MKKNFFKAAMIVTFISVVMSSCSVTYRERHPRHHRHHTDKVIIKP